MNSYRLIRLDDGVRPYLQGEFHQATVSVDPVQSVPAGCTQAVPDLSEADLAAIRQRFDAVAQHVSAEDNAAWANDFTEDAIFMFNHVPAIRGRAAIQAWGKTGVVVTNLTFDDPTDGSWLTAAAHVSSDLRRRRQRPPAQHRPDASAMEQGARSVRRAP
jgi:hypothetical protein